MRTILGEEEAWQGEWTSAAGEELSWVWSDSGFSLGEIEVRLENVITSSIFPLQQDPYENMRGKKEKPFLRTS